MCRLFAARIFGPHPEVEAELTAALLEDGAGFHLALRRGDELLSSLRKHGQPITEKAPNANQPGWNESKGEATERTRSLLAVQAAGDEPRCSESKEEPAQTPLTHLEPLVEESMAEFEQRGSEPVPTSGVHAAPDGASGAILERLAAMEARQEAMQQNALAVMEAQIIAGIEVRQEARMAANETQQAEILARVGRLEQTMQAVLDELRAARERTVDE